MASLHLGYAALLVAACGGVVGTNPPDGGGGGDDGGGGGDDAPGARFETTATAWTLPAGGIKIQSFSALSRQNDFENVGDEYWTTTDLTGDGVPDLVVTTTVRDVQGDDADDVFDETYGWPSQPVWHVYAGTRTGFATQPINWTLPQGGRIARGYNRPSNQTGARRELNSDGLFSKLGDEAWVVRDIDGDGKPDLVITGVATELVMLGYVFRVPGFGTAPFWKVYRNTGTGFSTSATSWPLPKAPGEDFGGLSTAASSVIALYTHSLWTLQDLSGDGKPDLVVTALVDAPTNKPRAIALGYPSAPRWDVYLNTGSGFSPAPTSFTLPVQRGTITQGLYVLSGSGAAEGDSAWASFDINGDAKPDLIVTGSLLNQAMKAPGYPADSHWEVYLNSGAGYGALTLWPLPRGGDGAGGFNATSSSGRNVAGDDAWNTRDLHGDGRPDLIVTGEFVAGDSQGVYQFGRLANDPHWQVYRNTGTGFEPEPTKWTLPMGGLQQFGFNVTSGTGLKIGDQNWSLFDLDGDHQPELAVIADVIERPDSPGFGITMPIAPGHPNHAAWQVFKNVP